MAPCSLYHVADMKTKTGQIAKARLPEREVLLQLLLYNLFLQAVDGIFSYSRVIAAASAPLAWNAIGGALYHKGLACLLLLLIVWLGQRKPDLAANALVITATIYTAFAVYSIYGLIA